MEKKYYDEGWDAFVKGIPFTRQSSIDWQDGWKDAKESGARKIFEEL